MAPSRYSEPECRNNLRSTTKIATRVLLISTLAALALCLLETPVHPVHASSGSLSLGSVQNQTALAACPPSGNWFSYTSGTTTYPMNCVSAGLNGCPNIQNLGFTYGYLSPSGIISPPVNGVIVFFNGAAGTAAAGYDYEGPSVELDMLKYYFQQGYEIVQVAWNSDWEAVWNPWPYSTSPLGNIQNAACRPATFLNYVYTNIYQSVAQGNSQAGMCAQGISAGSAQIVYSMAYYGAGSYLDNVELISGPVFSDIKQGCQEPQPSQVTICPSGQYGCQLGPNGSSWMLYPTYLSQSVSVGNWTDDPTCTSPNGTSGSSNSLWLAQSIVDQSGVTGQGATPTFSYPSTAMSAWLCRSIHNQKSNCSGSNYDPRLCPNNSSPQGEIFYTNIGVSNSPPVYNVYAVDMCEGPEGAPGGNVGSPTGPSGHIAIEQDMAGLLGAAPGQCFHGPH